MNALSSPMRQPEKSKTNDFEALRRLYEVGMHCSDSAISFEKCLDKILEAAIELTQAHYGNIQLPDTESGALRIAAQRGFSDPFLKFFAVVAHDDAASCGVAMQCAQRVVVEDITKSEIFAGAPSLDV